MSPRFHIVIPAWGERCVNTAIRYVIPSVKAALSQCDRGARIIVYSDRDLAGALEGCDGELRLCTSPGDDPLQSLHGLLHNLHRWTIAEAPHGSITVLLNADIVVSREFFSFAAEKIGHGCKAIAGTALRVLLKEDDPAPIGAGANELLTWAWRNRHRIAEDCVWGRGKSIFQNTVIFESDDGAVLHSVHLHPFFLATEDRRLKFSGTIDDDLLGNYADSEICFIRDGEVGFAELSPAGFKVDQYGSGQPLTVESVAKFGTNSRWTKEHLRNFRQPIRICGSGQVDSSAIEAIASRIKMKPHR